jgi:hypothetical protein
MEKWKEKIWTLAGGDGAIGRDVHVVMWGQRRSTVDGAGQVVDAEPLVYRIGLVDATTPKGKQQWAALGVDDRQSPFSPRYQKLGYITRDGSETYDVTWWLGELRRVDGAVVVESDKLNLNLPGLEPRVVSCYWNMRDTFYRRNSLVGRSGGGTIVRPAAAKNKGDRVIRIEEPQHEFGPLTEIKVMWGELPDSFADGQYLGNLHSDELLANVVWPLYGTYASSMRVAKEYVISHVIPPSHRVTSLPRDIQHLGWVLMVSDVDMAERVRKIHFNSKNNRYRLPVLNHRFPLLYVVMFPNTNGGEQLIIKYYHTGGSPANATEIPDGKKVRRRNTAVTWASIEQGGENKTAGAKGGLRNYGGNACFQSVGLQLLARTGYADLVIKRNGKRTKFPSWMYGLYATIKYLKNATDDSILLEETYFKFYYSPYHSAVCMQIKIGGQHYIVGQPVVEGEFTTIMELDNTQQDLSEYFLKLCNLLEGTFHTGFISHNGHLGKMVEYRRYKTENKGEFKKLRCEGEGKQFYNGKWHKVEGTDETTKTDPYITISASAAGEGGESVEAKLNATYPLYPGDDKANEGDGLIIDNGAHQFEMQCDCKVCTDYHAMKKSKLVGEANRKYEPPRVMVVRRYLGTRADKYLLVFNNRTIFGAKDTTVVNINTTITEANKQYNLKGFAVHLGDGLDNGHYIFVAKTPGTNTYTEYNDNSVTKIDMQEPNYKSWTTGATFYLYELEQPSQRERYLRLLGPGRPARIVAPLVR